MVSNSKQPGHSMLMSLSDFFTAENLLSLSHWRLVLLKSGQLPYDMDYSVLMSVNGKCNPIHHLRSQNHEISSLEGEVSL